MAFIYFVLKLTILSIVMFIGFGGVFLNIFDRKKEKGILKNNNI